MVTLRTVAIPTRDRPASLRAAASSCLRAARAHGRAIELRVYDVSSTSASVRANAEVLRGMAVEGGRHLQVRHLAHSYLRKLGDEICARGIDRRMVELALFDPRNVRHAPGATRNAMALDLAGEPFFSLDDDMRLEGPRIGDGGEAVVVPGDPTDFEFFVATPPAEAIGRDPGGDVLGAHERLLDGKSPADDPVERPVATWTGFYGDVATPNALVYLKQRHPSRERLLRSAVFYGACFSSGQVLRAVRRPTLSPGGFWTPGAVAYGGAELPPFFPVLRGQGLVFGALVRAALGKLLGYVPRAVLHAPPERRGFSDGAAARAAASFPMAMVVVAAIVELEQRTGPRRAHGCPTIGARMEALARLGESELLGWLRETRRRLICAVTAELRQLLAASGGEPEYWARDVRAYLAAASLSERRDAALPSDLRVRFGQRALFETRALLEGFGRLLQLWPDMMAAARSRRAGPI